MKQKVMQILEEAAGLAPGSLTPETKLAELPAFDSLVMVMALTELQAQGIEIPIDDALKLETVADFFGYCKE